MQSAVLALLQNFRYVAWLEGVSFILLLFVAMPLKYWAGMPLAVRIVGLVHGLLFIAYVGLATGLLARKQWTLTRTGEALGMSILPFGTFIFDRSVKRELEELERVRLP